MTREELVEIGRDAMGRSDSWRWWAPRHLERLLDVWEPIIREDEREQIRPAWDADVDFGNRMLLERNDALQILATLHRNIDRLMPDESGRVSKGLVLAYILGELDDGGEQVMPRVDGKSFRCQCGANVFTRRGCTFTCNGCGEGYEAGDE